MVHALKHPKNSVSIAVVGKYVELKESYKSLNEALVHGGVANHSRLDIAYIDSEKLNDKNAKEILGNVAGILVPGGFGERGVDGKLSAIKYARENNIPFFGICFGMQLAAIEFARNVCGIRDATSSEFTVKKTGGVTNFVIDFMAEQKNITDKGGTMRLGSYACSLKDSSLARKIYGESLITERHRHRYEFNNRFRPLFEKKGMSLSGVNKDRDLVEIIELPNHPWFVGVQFHPEFKSKPLAPHPLFSAFIEASLKKNKSMSAKTSPKVLPKQSTKGSSKLLTKALEA